ncbi:MAG: YbgC/FadM family acyl-CoA thioesterase [bacterium]|nr:YbgC/FadM family acyl-CoA thioesterase [bacterium]
MNELGGEPINRLTFPYRVFYADTDAGGVVYYAQYLRMFELARALYIEAFGMSLPQLEREGCLFVCRRAEIDYHSPARLGDSLDIHTWISGSGKTFLTFEYEIVCSSRVDGEGQPLRIVTGLTKMASVGQKDGRLMPSRIPAWLFDRLAQPV